MSKPNEITKVVLLARLREAGAYFGEIDDATVERLYERGKFSDFVGVVQKATQAAREKAAQTARRHKHMVTAQQIIRGE